MRGRKPSITPKLPSGTFRILSKRWMTSFFSRRLPRWYPGRMLKNVVIDYKKPIDFKLNVQYRLVLQDRHGKREERIVRANIPSVHTTHELMAAFQATCALWRDPNLLHYGITTRPLGLERSVRAFFYEEADGQPLLQLLRRGASSGPAWIARSAQWLRTLHGLHLTIGRRVSLAYEMRNTHYFSLNFEGYGKFIQRYHPGVVKQIARVQELLKRYRVARRRFEPVIQRNATLNHGDFHPSNMLVDEKNQTLSLIDFGNAVFADPYSDVTNTLVQLDLLPVNEKVPQRVSQAAQKSFWRSYTNGVALTKHERQRFSLFLLRWSLQTLSYTLALIVQYDKRPILQRSLLRAEKAFRDL